MTTEPTAATCGDWYPQARVKILLGITDGISASWRRKGIGPAPYAKLSHHAQFSYAPRPVDAVRLGLLGIGTFGLKLHGVPSPLTDEGAARVAGEAFGPLVPEGEMIRRLGVSKRIVAGWRAQGIGPRCIRSSFNRPYDYQASDVAELRKHLIELGRIGVALPGVRPLKA